MAEKGVAAKVGPAAARLAAELGAEIWDIEYKKEGADYVLRVFIDREGGVDIDLCENFSRRFSNILDEEDPIPGSYVLEVSSAGLDRELKRPSDFERFIGSRVEVKLFAAREGAKQFEGVLAAYRDGAVELGAQGGVLVFEKGEYSSVRLSPEF